MRAVHSVVKAVDLERHLRAAGCQLVRQGARHSIWRNPTTGAQTSVPRHREIPPTTAREMCKQLGVVAVGS